MGQPVLQTARLLLTPLAEEHFELEVELDSDPEVLRYIWGRALERDEVRKWHGKRIALGQEVDGLGYWVATLGGEFVGLMMLPPAGPGRAELGYRLARRWWRQGLATEGARELLRHGFETVGLDTVFAETMAVNTGSRGVMTAVGLHYVRTVHHDWDDPLPGTEEGEVEYEITRAGYARAR